MTGALLRPRVIRDPVYGYIALPRELAPVVDNPLVQRLRRVAQTSMTSTVYPSANGSRFEHALGAMHLARRGWVAAWTNGGPARADFIAALGADVPSAMGGSAEAVADRVGLAVACVALLHDVGHPPFSHVLEDVFEDLAPQMLRHRPDELVELPNYRSKFHEFAGVLLTRTLVRELRDDSLRKITLTVYESDPDESSWAGALHGIVANEIDVDRLDYLMRDASKAGTEFGAIDYERLIDALELHSADGEFRIAPGVRARSAVETLLIQRSQSYRWITFHPRVVGTNASLARAVGAVLKMRGDDTPLPGGGGVTLGGVLDRLVPHLNYLAPSADDLTRMWRPTPTVESAPGDAQLDLTEQEAAQQLERLTIELQASVDDSVITDLLKRASIICAQMLPSLVGDTRDAVLRFLTFSHTCLYREKNAIPAWKTVDEYIAAVTRAGPFVDEMPAVVRDVFDELEQRASQSAELRDIFAERRDDLVRRLAEAPVVAMNEIFHDVFAIGASRRSFERYLDRVMPDLRKSPGFWVVEYTNFQPVRTQGQLSTLYRGEDLVELRATTPVLEGLLKTESYRPRLAVFFFLMYPESAVYWGSEESTEARALLTGELFGALPAFLRETWADVLARMHGID